MKIFSGVQSITTGLLFTASEEDGSAQDFFNCFSLILPFNYRNMLPFINYRIGDTLIRRFVYLWRSIDLSYDKYLPFLHKRQDRPTDYDYMFNIIYSRWRQEPCAKLVKETGRQTSRIKLILNWIWLVIFVFFF